MSYSEQQYAADNLAQYNVGDSDQRPWGSYVVTALGRTEDEQEFCEKNITVNSGQIPSLQSHKMRRERWSVIQGALTVVLDDKRITLQRGQSLDIPLGAIHCMANLEETPCVVHERQEGVCREEDIARYSDAYGRVIEAEITPAIQASLNVYQQLSAELKAA